MNTQSKMYRGLLRRVRVVGPIGGAGIDRNRQRRFRIRPRWLGIRRQCGCARLATEGSHLAVFNSANSANTGYVACAIATIPGQRYLLTFDVGNLSYNKLPRSLFVGAPLGYKQWLFMDTITIPGPTGGATAWVFASYRLLNTPVWFRPPRSRAAPTGFATRPTVSPHEVKTPPSPSSTRPQPPWASICCPITSA